MIFNTVKYAMTSAIVLILGLLLTLTPLRAESIDTPESMTLLIKQGQLIKLPQAAKAVFIADPSIASYQAPSSNSLFIFGQSAGTTTLIVLGKNEEIIYSRTLNVKHDVNSLSLLIKQQFPLSEVKAVSTANRLILTGSASTPQNADKIVFLAQGYLSNSEADTVNNELINQLSIDLPTQVNIRVRIAEMDRGITREFGLDTTLALGYAVPLKTLGPLKNSLSAKLKALEQESLVSILAEPNLTTVSGESAQFLSGGEIPISVPVALGQPVSFDYRKYGVALDIVPTVLSPNRISLKVKPSVSEVSYRPNTSNNGAGDTPVFSTRMASTTVELASGQSFILGGLLHERENTIISEIPYLADIPILGALFRSEKYERKETELVIIATAYIVEPSRESNFHIPQHGMEPYDHWRRYLYGRILKPSGINSSSTISSSQPKMIGDYGFIF